ncbi:MAG: NAD-dependent DNA ligase LigA [Phytoplasma sp.]|uniref:NAD-dependent DNA ligase LigA n=1 Tax=Phytoplasma sp. TaxID=2155 RepID=UPI002B401A92|nr:NAD-dependent DNA ligase LigA [Phytoplasma sp.]WRH06554.1 MAG: NAD-dependent DNA ligase LigA [Phytoplasma sp.]
MTSEIKNKIKHLTDTLDKANYEYYHLSKTELIDHQYDALLKELFLLEKRYPEYKLPYSPTLKVGGFLSSKFEKTEHLLPMLSLDNVFNFEELKLFCERVLKKNIPFCFILEPKIDGVAINLKYKKGILVQAATRGNGYIGELITDNIRTIKNIPLKIKEEIDLEVRGEILFDHDSFEQINKEQKAKNKILFSNPRNAASGTLRQLNSNIVANRNLSSFIYSIVNPPIFIKTQEQVLIFLKKMGFSINPYYDVVFSFEALKEKIDYYTKIKTNLPYDIDGVVIKVNELIFHDLIGYTTKFPKWAVAYKFNSLKGETIIRNIDFQIGRTGVLTPIAYILPIIIDGSLLSKISLHNYDYIQKKDLRINDFVVVHKSGSIIPEIVAVVKQKRTNQIPFKMISDCPFCHKSLTKKDEEVDYFCLNDDCEERQIKKIIHFVSREAMDINVLGKKSLITFFQNKLIKRISDLYSLKDKYQQLKILPGFKDKKIMNILNALEASKNQTFDRILYGLGIDHVGIKIAKLLNHKFQHITNLKKVTFEELVQIPEIGPEIAHSICKYFQNEDNIKEIDLLQSKGIIFGTLNNLIENVTLDNIFKNKKVVLTGIFENYSRKEITVILEKCGAFVLDNISRKTHYLIKGVNSGSKLLKARLFNIKIIDEKELNSLLNLNKY